MNRFYIPSSSRSSHGTNKQSNPRVKKARFHLQVSPSTPCPYQYMGYLPTLSLHHYKPRPTKLTRATPSNCIDSYKN